MKKITILAQDNHIRSLFLNSSFIHDIAEEGDSGFNYDYFIVDNKYRFEILKNYTQEIVWETHNPNGGSHTLPLNHFFGLNSKVHHINPPKNSIIYVDRLLRNNFLRDAVFRYGQLILQKLDEIYKERNCKLILNWAYFEASDYECNAMSGLVSYPWSCKHIVLSDSLTFDDRYPNIDMNQLYSFWFHIYEHFQYRNFDEHESDLYNKLEDGGINYKQFLDGITNYQPTEDSKKYSFIVGNPGRFHRMYLLNKLIDSGLDKEGDISMKKTMFDEYYQNMKRNELFEGDCIFKPIAYEYWNQDTIKPKDYYKDVVDRIGDDLSNFNFNHQSVNVINKEFTNAYLDIYGDTHVMFETTSPLFSEKAYHGIFYKKLFLIFGSNTFYHKLKELGCHNFFEELGINEEEYLKDDNPIRQADMIYEVLERLSKKSIIELYEKTKDKREENHKLLYNNFTKITNHLREFITTE